MDLTIFKHFRDDLQALSNGGLIMQLILAWILITLHIAICRVMHNAPISPLSRDATLAQGKHKADYGEKKNVLLAIVGIPAETDVETVHLEDPSLKCAKPPNFPHDSFGPTGAYINGEVIVCGGYDDFDFDYSEKCFTLDVAGGSQTWTQTLNMTEKRLRSMSVMLDDETWFITGGTVEEGVLNTTEIFKDGIFSQGPTLPSSLFNHCLVQINETTTFLIGGYDKNSISQAKTYAYRWDLETWIEMRPMFQPRAGMACALIDRFGYPEVIVAGGDFVLDLDSVEILNLENGLWQVGPTLPQPMTDASFVSCGDKLILAGGYTSTSTGKSWLGTLYEFDPVGNSWIQMDQEMALGRSRFVALTIEEEFASCGTPVVQETKKNLVSISTSELDKFLASEE